MCKNGKPRKLHSPSDNKPTTKAHACDVCPFTTRRKKEYMEHLLEHVITNPRPEKKREKKSFQCEECEKTYKSVYVLKRHALFVHKKTGSLSKITHKCKFCEKTFDRVNKLKYHENSHTGAKPYKCNYCKKQFSTPTSAKNHVIHYHTQDFPYSCPECKKGFIYPIQVTKHMKICHSKAPPQSKS